MDAEKDPWALLRAIALQLSSLLALVLVANPYFFDSPVSKALAVWAAVTFACVVGGSMWMASRSSNIHRGKVANLFATFVQGGLSIVTLSAITLAACFSMPPSASVGFWTVAVVAALWSFRLSYRYRKDVIRTWSFMVGQLVAAGLVLVAAGLLTHRQAQESFSNMRLVEALQPNRMTCSAGPEGAIALLSDLHLVAKDGALTLDKSEPGNARIDALLQRIAAMRPSYLLIAGDITDRGLSEEWSLAISRLGGFATTTPVVLAPGNHDISTAFEGGLQDLAQGTRLQRFLVAQSMLFGRLATASGQAVEAFVSEAPSPQDPRYVAALSRLNACWSSCQVAIPSLPINPPPLGEQARSGVVPDVIKQHAECSQACSRQFSAEDAFVQRHMNDIQEYWSEAASRAFPLHSVDERAGLAVYALKMEPSPGFQGLGNNAVGYLDAPQAERLRSLVSRLPTSIHTVIVMTHHPLTRAPGDALEWPAPKDRTPMAYLDALYNGKWWNYAFLRPDFVEVNKLVSWLEDAAASQPARSYLLAYGHRHQRSLGRAGPVTVIEAPNVASRSDPGFYWISPGASSVRRPSVQVSWCAIS